MNRYLSARVLAGTSLLDQSPPPHIIVNELGAAVRRAVAEFMESTGLTPTTLYLGRDEQGALFHEASPYSRVPCADEGAKYMGMSVHWVREASHIGVSLESSDPLSFCRAATSERVLTSESGA